MCVFFFFQAEDGIRDVAVTGVQTCALPIYLAPLNGAKLVFPGAGLDGKSLFELFEAEKVTNSAGVPTVWLALLAHMKQNNLKFSTLKTVTVGGSACPPAMIDTFRDDYRSEERRVGKECRSRWS